MVNGPAPALAACGSMVSDPVGQPGAGALRSRPGQGWVAGKGLCSPPELAGGGGGRHFCYNEVYLSWAKLPARLWPLLPCRVPVVCRPRASGELRALQLSLPLVASV